MLIQTATAQNCDNDIIGQKRKDNCAARTHALNSRVCGNVSLAFSTFTLKPLVPNLLLREFAHDV